MEQNKGLNNKSKLKLLINYLEKNKLFENIFIEKNKLCINYSPFDDINHMSVYYLYFSFNDYKGTYIDKNLNFVFNGPFNHDSYIFSKYYKPVLDRFIQSQMKVFNVSE